MKTMQAGAALQCGGQCVLTGTVIAAESRCTSLRTALIGLPCQMLHCDCRQTPNMETCCDVCHEGPEFVVPVQVVAVRTCVH